MGTKYPTTTSIGIDHHELLNLKSVQFKGKNTCPSTLHLQIVIDNLATGISQSYEDTYTLLESKLCVHLFY